MTGNRASCVVVCLLAAAVPAGLAGAAPPPYVFNDLGEGIPQDINNSGQIVGSRFFGPGRNWYDRNAFLWENGTYTDLGGRAAVGTDINERGQVVGRHITPGGTDRSVLWEGGAMTDLNIRGDSNSRASAINESGQIAGNYRYWTAYLLDGDQYSELAFNGNSRVYDMNNLAQIVGRTDTGSNYSRRPFLWHDGVLTQLPAGTESGAEAINDLGQVVGYVGAGALSRAALWDSHGLAVLGTLGGQCVAHDINECGQVVGTSMTPTGDWHPFLWQEGQMYDLYDLVNVPDGYRVEGANAINDFGQIVCEAYLADPGENRVVRLDPIPEPATLALLAVGSLLLIRRRTRRGRRWDHGVRSADLPEERIRSAATHAAAHA